VLLDSMSDGDGDDRKSGPSSRKEPPPQLTTKLQLAVYGAVHAWRATEAAQSRRRPFQILQARTLVELSIEQPKTSDELGAIFGIGPVKHARYGERLLELIANIAEEELLYDCNNANE